jgi:menaquinol-cytochrome c reductase iron-sulfur subunit
MSHEVGTETETTAPATMPPGRRSVLKWLTFAISGVATALLAIPFVGYLFGALRKHQDEWVKLGPATGFPLNETRLHTFDNPLGTPWDATAARMGVYVRNLGENQFLVFAMNCAHLGCPVTWFPQSGLFMCPCHGGVYYEDGERASGPPTRGLFQCVWRIQNNELEIQAPHLPTLQHTLESKSEIRIPKSEKERT